MPQQQRVPAIGEDVTALMGGATTAPARPAAPQGVTTGDLAGMGPSAMRATPDALERDRAARAQAPSGLPAAAATLGGVMGGPAGAGAGGMLGEGARQLLQGEAVNPRGIATEGAVDAALGYVVPVAARAAGRGALAVADEALPLMRGLTKRIIGEDATASLVNALRRTIGEDAIGAVKKGRAMLGGQGKPTAAGYETAQEAAARPRVPTLQDPREQAVQAAGEAMTPAPAAHGVQANLTRPAASGPVADAIKTQTRGRPLGQARAMDLETLAKRGDKRALSEIQIRANEAQSAAPTTGLPDAWQAHTGPIPPRTVPEIDGSKLAAAFQKELAGQGISPADAIKAVKANRALPADVRKLLVDRLTILQKAGAQ